MDWTTTAATALSFMFRPLEAALRMVMAVAWLHRFWAMMIPVTTSMIVRVLSAALR
jgi:hypothetical protein